MTPWFLIDAELLKRERSGIEMLSSSVDWLTGTEWCLDEGLHLDAVIRAHGHDYEVRVSYPPLFPDAPIVVRPRNMQSRISSHQYGGADGPLCLEWGPDNWHREITAVQMLESAHRLFQIENPLGENRPELPVAAPSRHKLTAGQELRGEWARWLESQALTNFLRAQPLNSVGSFKFSLRKTGENWTILVHEASPLEGSAWTDEQIPPTLPGTDQKELDVGVWFKTELPGKVVGKPAKLAGIKETLVGLSAERFLATDGTSPIEGFQKSIAGVLIVDRDGDLRLFIVLSGDSVVACAPVRQDGAPVEIRSPESKVLAGKTVGIVGLGSVGSKIAISLARMGLQKFYLVDSDVLLPENLRRHALDWQAVAQHKVDSMSLALAKISAGAKVDVCRLHLTGQESNAAVSGALNKLAGCDLLIDATANSKVFNLVGAVARSASRPMVWMEVFGGGLGGMVARSRPRIDPPPQDMRGAFLQYCTDYPDPTAKNSTQSSVVSGH
jgi:molybdopterin/thiamine biosynthesis adenylyltransferase